MADLIVCFNMHSPLMSKKRQGIVKIDKKMVIMAKDFSN